MTGADGDKVILDIAITPNEIAWIEFIRLASRDTDPAPTLGRVQRLQQIFRYRAAN